ncbi:MAG: stringent starvation protein B [Woeseiaceae bacterium]|jgi:stringent starvation protein B|tara:strand:+ start:195 stop:578 length:384 start_codon:yes stop_codon:yes gene_type:complete
MELSTISKRPYLIKAMIEWINDNNFTPHILVDTLVKDVMVPEDFIQDDKIILNISHSASSNLNINLQSISFDGRFNGNSTRIFVPSLAILSVYAKETGEGMVFNSGSDQEVKKDKITKKPTHLKLVE